MTTSLVGFAAHQADFCTFPTPNLVANSPLVSHSTNMTLNNGKPETSTRSSFPQYCDSDRRMKSYRAEDRPFRWSVGITLPTTVSEESRISASGMISSVSTTRPWSPLVLGFQSVSCRGLVSRSRKRATCVSQTRWRLSIGMPAGTEEIDR